MTERESFDLSEMRRSAHRIQHGRCFTCGKSIPIDCMHMAHIIPQRKHWLVKYGGQVIFHRLNMVGTCPTDRCNNSVSLGNNGIRIAAHAAMIRAKIKADKKEGT